MYGVFDEMVRGRREVLQIETVRKPNPTALVIDSCWLPSTPFSSELAAIGSRSVQRP